MGDRISNFKLGIFIFSGTALLTVMVVLFGAGVFSPPGVVVETYIDGSVQGLDIGSPMKFRGVKIGRVTEINLAEYYYVIKDPRQAHIVVVRMEVDPPKNRVSNDELVRRIKQWTDQGMRLRITSQGVTGVAFVEAEFVKAEDDKLLNVGWKPEEIYIPSTRTQLARVADSIENIAKDLEEANLPQIASNVEQLLTSMNSAVTDANIKGVSEDIRASLQRLQSTADSIESFVNDPELQAMKSDLAGAAHEIKATAAEAREEIAHLSGKVSSTLDQTEGALVDARSYLNDPEFRNSVERLNAMTARLESVLFTLETSIQDKDGSLVAIMNDLKVVSGNMREFSELISRYPSLAAFGESPTPTEVYDNE